MDRLAERGLVDRWGFLAFAFVGAGAILVAKSVQVSPVLVAAAAASAMAAYAAIVQTSGSGRLRSDQAGDNCYYLGLIYTLVSLAFAIFTFDPNDTATTIVQGFGIALATTIVGLILRVFFHQSRVDLVETEDTARIELAVAAGRLKTELSSVVVSFNDFGRQTRQSLEELRDEMLQSLNETRALADRALRRTIEEANAAVVEETAEGVAKAKRFSAATEKVVSGIERHAEVLTRVEAATVGISAGLETIHAAATSSSTIMQGYAEQVVEVKRLQTDSSAVARDLKETVSQLLENVRLLDATANRFDALVTSKLDAVRATPETIAGDAKAAIERVLGNLHASVEGMVTVQRDLTERLAVQASESLSRVDRHNEALEAELARSRENVAKVHAALVDMTGQLAERLESQVA